MPDGSDRCGPSSISDVQSKMQGLTFSLHQWLELPPPLHIAYEINSPLSFYHVYVVHRSLILLLRPCSVHRWATSISTGHQGIPGPPQKAGETTRTPLVPSQRAQSPTPTQEEGDYEVLLGVLISFSRCWWVVLHWIDWLLTCFRITNSVFQQLDVIRVLRCMKHN